MYYKNERYINTLTFTFKINDGPKTTKLQRFFVVLSYARV